jgi:hypothetical protein
MGIEQVCERINDTLVVRCVDQIQPETYLGLEISDLISAIIAVFSVMATGFAAYAAWNANQLTKAQEEENNRRQSLSVRPYFTAGIVSNDSRTISFEISNKGTGLARIKSLKAIVCNSVALDSSTLDHNIQDKFIKHLWDCFYKAYEKTYPEQLSNVYLEIPSTQRLSMHMIHKSDIFPANQDIELFKYCFQYDYHRRLFSAMYEDIEIVIEYEDIYGNSFIQPESLVAKE